MGLQALTTCLRKGVAPMQTFCSAVAGATLALMMLLTAADVGLRYLLNSPIPGALEVVEYMMAVIVPFALMVTAIGKAHIGVDLIVERFPVRIQSLTACLTHFMCFCLYALMTWQSFLNISEQYNSEMTSAVLLIPVYPFVASLTAALALLTLITALHFLEKLIEVVSQWTHF